MGYRNYIGFIPKREYNKIKSLTTQEVFDYYNVTSDDGGDSYMGVYDFGKELYEFGKYVDFNPPKGSIKTFFKKKDTESNWNNDGELKVVTKEFLGYVIETYRERIMTYYNDMMTPFLSSDFTNSVKTNYGAIDDTHTFDFSLITEEEQTALFKMINHVRSMRTEWTCLVPYNLDDRDEITGSWKYEYSIFELVRIYKSFDWKRNIMIYYGH